MAIDPTFLVTDRDYYQPWDTADPGPRYHPGPLPADWRCRKLGPWTYWGPAGLVLPDPGLEGARLRLRWPMRPPGIWTLVSQVCAESGIPFKHLTGRRTFMLMHDKHAAQGTGRQVLHPLPGRPSSAHRQLMQRLAAELAGISGPSHFADRRYGDQRMRVLRYGAFRSRTRWTPMALGSSD